MSHDRLMSYYHMNFTLSSSNNFTLEEIDNMMPWERVLYIALLEKKLNEEEEELKKLQQGRS